MVTQTFEPAPGTVRDLNFDWWWLAAPLALLLAALAWLMRRRKPVFEDDEPAAEEGQIAPEAAPPEQLASTVTGPLPVTPPVTLPATLPSPDLAAVQYGEDEPLGLELEVGRLNATLINATLTWRLTVENRSKTVLGPVMVAGDMIAAHASLPVEQQLATDGQPLELRDEIGSLEAGQKIEIKGEFRVPLASINPIRSGSAILFIPLARFRVEAEGTSALATFAVGETPPVAAAALLPFRLDLGPRTWQQISQRRVSSPLVPA